MASFRALLPTPIPTCGEQPTSDLQLLSPHHFIMSPEVANRLLDHQDSGEECSVKSLLACQSSTPAASNILKSKSPIGGVLLGLASSGDEEVWIPHSIHTAVCDSCGERNKSVVQRSSRENKQFCKPCMYLNVRNGIYSVNVEQMDWTPQNVSLRRRVREGNKPRKPSHREKLLVPKPVRVSKRKQKEETTPARKRRKLAEQLESPVRSKSGLYVAEDQDTDKEGDTDENIDFGYPASDKTPSSERQRILYSDPRGATEAAEQPSTDENDENREESSEGDMENTETRNTNTRNCLPWWNLSQPPISNIRVEPPRSLGESVGQSGFLERQRSTFSPEAVAAADILVMLSKDPRELLTADLE